MMSNASQAAPRALRINHLAKVYLMRSNLIVHGELKLKKKKNKNTVTEIFRSNDRLQNFLI